jgi:fermentation-respiration switch protein FrsA (DUF1100 family)
MFKSMFTLVSLLLLFFSSVAVSQTADTVPAYDGTSVLKEGLVINLGRPDRSNIITQNAVVTLMETGEWESPSENEEFEFNDEVIGTWRKITAGNDGWFREDTLFNSYIYLQYKSSKEDIVLLEGMGNSMAYVNGSARSGNPYQGKDTYESWEPRFDYSLIPVKLQKGNNEFLFECNRGGLKAKIHLNKKGLIFNENDLTVPDIILNETVDTYGAIPIINATENSYKDLFIKTWSEGSAPEYYPVSKLNPLSIYKTPFYIKLPVQQSAGEIRLNIDLIEKKQSKEEILSSLNIELNVVSKYDIHKETFISKMDGSVQYYAVNPPENPIEKPALFLSLHGAGVEATNQAHAYGRKNWGYLVAPTNRRPYGYNWENWGRLDGLEVLNVSKKKFNIDENRVYLTGHSMGGHGTWHLGLNYPDKFAAMGPSAGWISIWAYRIRSRSASDSSDVKNMLMRSSKQSDTYAFTTNLAPNGLYILHGEVDDNVPPEQARSIVENLSKFHKDYIYYEQPGANHWWDNSDEPGADCVDWMPMFDFFAHHSVPGNERIKMIDFVTSNPAISSKNYWIEIINQVEQQNLSKIKIRVESGNRKFVGTTDNIETLSIDALMLSKDEPVSVELDGQIISGINIPSNGILYLKKENDKWGLTDEPGKQNKYPARCGNIREALNYDVVFVYGTHGSKEENIWAYEKARYDAERIWYQGNGSIEIIKDDEFDPVKLKDRSVILFGNSKTNSAWKKLLKDSPVQVGDEEIKFGNKVYEGDDYACLMIRPRTDSEFASVAVISGTGIEGMRLANFAQYHHPYLNFPDIVVYNSDIKESDEQGVKLAGYFGNNWSIEKGEFVGR